MNWVKYLEDNCQISNIKDTADVKRVVDLAAMSLQFKYGWYSYSVVCSPQTLHFMYTTPEGLFSTMIPMSKLAEGIVVKPLLERVVKMHSENIPSYRKK
jgi:hypothetical protein